MFGSKCDKIKSTSCSYSLFLMRLLMGWIFFKAGTGKLFGWFGGNGLEKTIGFFTSINLPMPEFQAYLVGSTEALAGLALVLGFLVRLVSIPVIIIMIVAIVTVHNQSGYYYPLMIIFASAILIEKGAGSFSLDKCCSENCS